MKYTLEEKLKIVQQIKNGYSLHTLSHQLCIDNKILKNWVYRYEQSGESGLLLKPVKHLTVKEKEQIVLEHEKKGVPLQELSHKYDISFSSVCVWVRKYRLNGTLSKGKNKNKSMPRPHRKGPETELEKLQAENLRLRAENALLKKVRTLVMEERLQAQRNGQKPSKN